MSLLLASASPRRYQLLQQLGIDAQQQTADIDESVHPAENDRDYVMRMATGKAAAIAASLSEKTILAADTVISLDGQLIGKPRDFADACRIWQSLSGCWHQVLTGVVLHHQGRFFSALSCSDVQFTVISSAQMRAYWESGEPQDKAGAYAIQGYAAQWIPAIRGSYSGIMGLPLFETADLLRQAGLKVLL